MKNGLPLDGHYCIPPTTSTIASVETITTTKEMKNL
jgi:hypothetical protein